jgi:hypothetical protein
MIKSKRMRCSIHGSYEKCIQRFLGKHGGTRRECIEKKQDGGK